MPLGNPGAYSNPRSKHFIPSGSKRKQRIKANLSKKRVAPGGGKRKFLPMAPAGQPNRQLFKGVSSLRSQMGGGSGGPARRAARGGASAPSLANALAQATKQKRG